MALFLIELEIPGRSREEVGPLLDRVGDIARQTGGELVEAQVAASLLGLYAVVEHGDRAALEGELRAGGLLPGGIAEVRLVGATLDQVKAARRAADYLVEWDFPAGLTMEAYLARKRASAPRYAEVPDVRFLRTYVCEDMSRCLCFYLAQDEAAVRRARQAVGAPVSRLTGLTAPPGTPGGRAVGAHSEQA